MLELKLVLGVQVRVKITDSSKIKFKETESTLTCNFNAGTPARPGSFLDFLSLSRSDSTISSGRHKSLKNTTLDLPLHVHVQYSIQPELRVKEDNCDQIDHF